MKVPGFYSLVLDDSDSIANAWIPFLVPGGLWVLARREHVLGEEVVLLVQLPDGSRHSVTGRVAWLGVRDVSRGSRRKAGIALEGAEGSELATHIRQLASASIDPAEALLSCS